MSLKNSIYKLKRELKNLEDSGYNSSSKAYKDRKKLLQKKELMLKSKKGKGKITLKTHTMLNKAKKQQQEVNKLFNSLKQRTNTISSPLIPFKKNDCECKTAFQKVGNINITNNTCYCNIERNHQKHIKNKKSKKSRISKFFTFFKRSNNSGLGKGKRTKKGKSKSK